MSSITLKLWNCFEKFMRNIIIFFLKLFKIEVNPQRIDDFMQFFKFGLVGLSNTFISYVVYFILIRLGCYYLIASVIGFLASILNAFYLNNKYVFKENEGQKRLVIIAFIKTFISYAGTGLILANILLFLWVDIMSLPEALGPILNLLITIPLNFLLNKLWAFKEK